jgi:SpoIID/LytB domain protein
VPGASAFAQAPVATIVGILFAFPLRRRALARVVPAALVLMGFSAFLALTPARPAAAYPSANVSLVGHGFGHGHGMGQWGALGYALQGLSYPQILSTYYGTLSNGTQTTVGILPNGWNDASTPVTVALTANAGNDVIVTSGSAFTVSGGLVLPAGWGARFQFAGPGNLWNVYTSSGGCGGNGNWGAPVATNVPSPMASPGVFEPFPSDGSLASEALKLCMLPISVTVRGTLQGTVNSSNQPRTVNVLPLGQYVADVTPSESPASWGALGGGLGNQELEAQAVAVRSYVMSRYGGLQGYFGYADICDSTACQDYVGIADENAITDTATTATANTAVLMPDGTVATTQYSSSTGGYTSPGNFAAVPDLGDSVCVPGACNSHHTWQAQVPVTAIMNAYPQLGTLESVGVSARNNLGDVGGRVVQMTLQGSASSVTISGDTFASQFFQYGVQSNWFAVASQSSGGVGGYWLVASDGGVFSFGNAGFHGSAGNIHLVKPVVGMASTPDAGGYWLVASDGGVFSYGNAGFHGSAGNIHLVKPVVGMASTPDGGGYWLVASDGGVFSYGNAGFHGSAGNIRLAKPVVGMAPTPDGGGYWLVASDGGVFSYGDAVFHGSLGALRLAQPVAAMAATPDGGGYWLVGADGGVFALGNAGYLGSLPGLGVNASGVALLPTRTGAGYVIVTTDGRTVDFGDSPQFGDVADSVVGWHGTLVGGAVVSG